MKLNRGFTLIEMLIVIAIISVLTGLIMPVIAKSRGMGTRLNCQANLKQIGYALNTFAGEYDEVFPTEYWHWSEADRFNKNSGSTLGMLYPKYVDNLKLFVCPASKDADPVHQVVADADNKGDFGVFTTVGSYAYQRTLLRRSDIKIIIVTDEDAIGTDYLVTPSSPNHVYEGSNCLWIKGHVTWELAESKALGVVKKEGLYSTDNGIGYGAAIDPPIAQDILGASDAALNYDAKRQPPHDIMLLMTRP